MRLRYLLVGFLLGLYVGWVWFSPEERAPSQETPKPAPRRASTQEKDTLTEIEGIGPAYERALNAVGIFSFAQLAAQDVDALAGKLTTVRISAARIRQSKWIEQAKAKTRTASSGKQQSWVGNDNSSKTEGSDTE